MSDVPAFFVPGVIADKQEEAFAAYAEMCHRDAPAAGRRIHSITFTHDGTVWTATVGEPLRGYKITTHRSKGRKY